MKSAECDTAVVRGMALLDKTNSQWLGTTNLATLDVGARRCCPLAQVSKMPFEKARKAMDRIAKAIIRGTPVEKPNRRHARTLTATRS